LTTILKVNVMTSDVTLMQEMLSSPHLHRRERRERWERSVRHD